MKNLPPILRGNSTPLRLNGRNAFSSRSNDLEIARRGNADRRAVVPAAPGDVIRAVDLAQPRIVGVVGRRVWIAIGELNRLRFDLPIDSVIAPADVQVREPATLLQAEHADEAVAVRRHGAVVDSLHARHVMPADDRICRMTPDDVVATGRSLLPGNRREIR